MVSSLQFKQEKKGDVLVLFLEGRLDALTSSATEKKWIDLVQQGEKYLLLDCADVNYLSSAGLRSLLNLNKKIQATQGQLVLCSLSPSVQDILNMSGFHHVLTLKESIQEGLDSFKLS